MTEQQIKEDRIASGIDPELERVKARDKRIAEFQRGLWKVDFAIREGRISPQGRIRQILDESIAAFDANTVPTMHTCWATLEYIGSFDMTYSYMGTTEAGEDEETGRTYYTVCGDWDSLDQVSLTELLRKELTHYLVAAGALAKRTGSSTYEGWVALIRDINFKCRCSFYIFSKEYPFDKFYEKLEELIQHLWADNEIAQHTPTTQKKGRFSAVWGGTCVMKCKKVNNM